ncbi:hypothetical protein [Roseibacillus persicicus]|uniref:hypothetical protein n=1 Tax=Roseibacillus persicicus TaxID=454148 RepID=UPI00280E6C7C|nr:hypothetical protein [Roseibacillus persicicus]MDQ8191289.1 hypothetical protein [Roseibacillus persicicus]
MNLSDLENHLRQEHPQEVPRPGLDTRIQANLPQGKKRPFAAWLSCATVAVHVIVVAVMWKISSPSLPSESGARQTVEANASLSVPTISPQKVFRQTPLEKEAVALQNTARKATSFLLSRFPSLPEEQS